MSSLDIIISVGSAIELSASGLLRAAREHAWLRLNRPALEVALRELVMQPRYQKLFRGRERAHLFLAFGDEDTIDEPALFPAGESWCQLCSLQLNARAFFRFARDAQREHILAQVRAALDAVLGEPASGGKGHSKDSPAEDSAVLCWLLEFPCSSRWGSDDELALRHRIESALDELLAERGWGEVEGGQIGDGSAEVFLIVAAGVSQPLLKRDVKGRLRDAGIVLPRGWRLRRAEIT